MGRLYFSLVALAFLAFAGGLPDQSSLVDYTYSPEKSSTCFTVEKRALEKKPCIFPFKYKGSVYKGCLTRNDPDSRKWCSTEVDLNGYHVLGREFWGHCGNECPVDLKGVTIRSIQSLPKLGPRLKPFQTSGLSPTALDIVGQSGISAANPEPDIIQPEQQVLPFDPRSSSSDLATSNSATQLEIPDDINWFKSPGTGGTWSFNCRFQTSALRKVRLVPSACIQTCRTTNTCNHFTWSNGICSLQGTRNVGPSLAQYTQEPQLCGYFETTSPEPSVTASGVSATAGALNWLTDNSALSCDFRSPSYHSEASDRSNCINLCRKFDECTHYTWTGEANRSVGICSLKRGHVTRSDAFPSGKPSSLCGIRISREDQDNSANRIVLLSNQPASGDQVPA